MNTKEKIIKALENRTDRSAWDKAVTACAIDLVYGCDGEVKKENLLNGAIDWSQYSYGGCSLIYDADIAEAYCTPSELKRTDHGRLQPNSRESWLDLQARALGQAYRRIMGAKRIVEIHQAA